MIEQESEFTIDIGPEQVYDSKCDIMVTVCRFPGMNARLKVDAAMTEKELHKLSREDLLRLLLAQSKEVSRRKAELEKTSADRDEARDTLARLKDKLNEKDEQIERLKDKLNEKDALLEKLKGRLDEKDAELASYAEMLPEAGERTVVRTEGISDDLRAALGAIETRLSTLSEQIEKRDEENKNLWAILDSMMDQME